MKRISIYKVQQVKERGGLYDVKTKIEEPSDVYDVLEKVLNLSKEAVENFGIVTLNSKNKIVGIHVLSVGSLDSALITPRRVFSAAILNNAAAIILFHNHPSGDLTPSPEDYRITKRLREAGEIMNIEVLDHVIVADYNFKSLDGEV